MKLLKIVFAGALMVAGQIAQAHPTSPSGDKGATIKLDFDSVVPNIPGKSVKTVMVTYAPGGSSAPHTHAKSAFIVAYVLEGQITTSVNDGPQRTYKTGEHWIENPGDRHSVTFNPSKTKNAKLLAFFVVDTNDTELVIPDPR